MKIKIFSPGKFKRESLSEIFQNYQKRVLSKIELIEESDAKFANRKLAFDDLPEKIKSTKIIVLCESGENLSSVEFAKYFDALKIDARDASFIIGPASGIDDSVLKAAHKKICYGRATFPHLMVRVMLIEQIYRAESILAGHPYHKD